MNAPIPEWRRPLVAVSLTQAFPELGEVKEFRSKVCLFNHSRTKVFDVVSDRYQAIEHGQAVDIVSNALTKYFDTESKFDVRSFSDGARIVGTFSLPIKPIRLGKNDVNEIRLLLRNSYDRSCPFHCSLGAYRLICSNGAKVGEVFGEINARHVGIGDDSDILSMLDVMINNIPRLQGVWQGWMDTRVEFEEAAELLTGHFPDKYLLPVLDPERFPKSKWDLYNNLTHFATHDTKSVQRRLEFDDQIAKLFYDEV